MPTHAPRSAAMASSEGDLANSVTIDDVRAAHVRIAPYVRRTPVLRDPRLDDEAGAELFFKCENLQTGGAFKMRGATNAVLSLSERDAAHGVATHSSGNHGAALAIAAQRRGIPAYIVVPRNARATKRAAIAAAGATLVECEPTLAARETALAAVVARTGAHFVPPYDDPRIVAGQGTAALELIDEVPGLAQIWVPVGGGGLAAGTTVVGAAAVPPIEVVCAEPAGADDAYRSLAAGRRILQTDPRTMADGLLTSLGELNFAILHAHRVRVALASEAAIAAAVTRLNATLGVAVEPSAAVPYAALLESPAAWRGARIALVLSGGNI
jgi:threonine dehydratase